MTQSCKTCKWSEFARTPTGRIKRNLSGACTVPFFTPGSVPASIRYSWPRCRVWPDDGKTCIVWMKVV